MKALLGIFITVSLFGASLPSGDDDTHTTWELDAAVDPVFRLADRDHVASILERVNEGASYRIQWRTRVVPDQRRTSHPQISAEREWLWRWSRDHPRDIFRYGFRPRVNVLDMLRFAAAGPHRSTNLRLYVANNIASVFVSTTQGHWAPRSRARAFRYDIFAPGGIDVNPTIGRHNFANQMEIAFVGGIRAEYIYGAVELDRRNRQIRYHRNTLYRGPDEPLASRRTRYCNLEGISYNRTWPPNPTDYCKAFRPTRKKRDTSSELMRSPGLILEPRSDCSYWYKVNIQYLNFDQPSEVGQIEPYGDMSVHINGRDPYETSFIFEQSSNVDVPSVPNNKNLVSKAKCLVLQSDTDPDMPRPTVRVCFSGQVDEYDPYSGDDQIARKFLKCEDTSPSTYPFQPYNMVAPGNDGSLKWAFKISPCDQKCLKKNLRDNKINGEC